MPIDKEGTVKCYDAVAPLYSFFRNKTCKADNEIMPFVLEVLDPAEGDAILDAGTGPGIYAIKLAERQASADIHGVDLSPAFLELARKNAQEAGFHEIKFGQGDLENLPYDNERFDKLVCAGVISAVPNRNKAAAEIYRVLKPGGKAVITEPNKGEKTQDRWFLFFLYLLGLLNPRRRGFTANDMSRYYFNHESFYALFNRAGFESIAIADRGGSLCGVCVKQRTSGESRVSA